MSKMNKIGLDKEQSSELVDKLNDLLANYQVFYQNTRGFHWNIRGEKFFELHAKFEELYNDLQTKIDEIAERILTLGGTPLHTYDDYLKVSKVKSLMNVTKAKDCVESIVMSFGILLERQRIVLELSARYEDEGTNAMSSDYIREQEKLVWMYNAWLD